VLTGRSGTDLSDHFSDLDLASRKVVIAAVSGGSDSLALMFLLKDRLNRSAPDTRLVAVTVNHRLRSGSAAEAAAVGRLCASLRIEHRSLAWSGGKPSSGLPAAAREARHDMLAEAARREGTDLVLTAHTADDQAETVLMRQARDEGRGLAGISPATLFCRSVWFARPLLAVRRQALRGFLEERGVSWADDPTNEDDAYERPRIRKTLRGPDGEARVATALLISDEAAAERRASGKRAADLIRDHATQPAPGLTRLDRHIAEGGDAALYCLRVLLAVAGGTPHLPDAGRVAELMSRLAGQDSFRAVLSRCLVDARPVGVFLLREGRGLPPAMPLADDMAWDGRFRIAGAAAGRVVMPFGPERARTACTPESACPASLARAALAAEPLIPEAPRRGGQAPDGESAERAMGDSAAPDGKPCIVERLVSPWARYLPSFDVAPARAAAVLVGAPEISGPPFRGQEWT